MEVEDNVQSSKRWLTPQEVMQRRMATRKNSSDDTRKKRPLKDSTSGNVKRTAAKRKNPFRINSAKNTLELDHENIDTSNHTDLKTFMDKTEADHLLAVSTQYKSRSYI